VLGVSYIAREKLWLESKGNEFPFISVFFKGRSLGFQISQQEYKSVLYF
jgi:hypothetical protein